MNRRELLKNAGKFLGLAALAPFVANDEIRIDQENPEDEWIHFGQSEWESGYKYQFPDNAEKWEIVEDDQPICVYRCKSISWSETK